MHAAAALLRKLDSVYHEEIRFITGAEMLTHHWISYDSLDWLPLQKQRKFHVYLYIAKALTCKLPAYISHLLLFNTTNHCTHSGSGIRLVVLSLSMLPWTWICGPRWFVNVEIVIFFFFRGLCMQLLCAVMLTRSHWKNIQ